MATSSFLNRWSTRKLEQSSHQPDEVDQSNTFEEGHGARCTETLPTEDSDQCPESVTNSVSIEEEKPEGMSIANLLASEVSESVKKAALRQLFLSEAFNVRDGLDDYDDDYSNLKSLSEGVADTLRDWIKDQSEEPIQEAQAIPVEDETMAMEARDLEQDSDENLTHTKVLYKNTGDDKNNTLASVLAPESEKKTGDI